VQEPFVPDDFVVPASLTTSCFQLEPLTERHNELDHAAWTSSLEHIHNTPGFSARGWPTRMTLQENRLDLARHHRDFEARTGFTYAVFDTHGSTYIGCVYFYPPRDDEHDVEVRSWVRGDLAELDQPLVEDIKSWLTACWPWKAPDYAPRPPHQ
jgi:hypothetical protein